MRSHPLDLISLVFGIIFTASAVLWLAATRGALPQHALLWIIPGGLVLVGVAGLAHAVRSIRAPSDRTDR